MKSVLKLILIAAALLGGALAFGQTDITGPGPGQTYAITPTLDLTRGANWNGSGNVQTVNNSFVFTAVSTNTGTCLYIANNNTTSAHSYLLEVAVTQDSKETRFLNSAHASRWRDVYPGFQSGINDTVLANGTNSYYFPTTGGAKVAVSITGASTAAGSPDTADIYLTQGSNGCASPAMTQQGSVSGVISASVPLRPPVSCDTKATAVVASATTAQIVAIQAAALKTSIVVCSYSITGGGAAETASTITFTEGTGATCVGAATDWQIKTAASQVFTFALAMANGFIFAADGSPGNNNLCVVDGGTTTGETVSISYAIIPAVQNTGIVTQK